MPSRWETAILDAVQRIGGKSVTLQEIYREMEGRQLVTPYHLQPWKDGGQPRYQCWIRRCITNLGRVNTI